MLKIRLSRIGKNKYATFRIVVAEHARAVKGKALEVLGSYDPHTDAVRVKTDRVKYWLTQGAHVSPTVHNLLVDEKVIEGKKVTAWKPPKKTAEKAAAEAPGAAAPSPQSTETEKQKPSEPASAGAQPQEQPPAA